jgi:crotonobetainyl-CoA:carnitine CoA-transferase CaiB-like acyl-CoA transferase
MQEAVTWTLMNASQYWDLNRVVVGRSGAVKRNPSGVTARMHWPCKDGYVTFAGGAEWDGLSRWMRSAGFDHPALHREYKSLPPFALKQTEVDTLERLALDFFKERTAQELYDGALQWRIMLYPVYTMEQILRYRQLLERGFWRQVKHEGLGRTLTYPGSFIRTTMGWPQLRGRAPRVGEHNRQVYQGELGLSDADLQALKAAGAV